MMNGQRYNTDQLIDDDSVVVLMNGERYNTEQLIDDDSVVVYDERTASYHQSADI